MVLTPPSLVAVLATGWEGVVPLLHPSAVNVGDRLKPATPARTTRGRSRGP